MCRTLSVCNVCLFSGGEALAWNSGQLENGVTIGGRWEPVLFDRLYSVTLLAKLARQGEEMGLPEQAKARQGKRRHAKKNSPTS